MRIVNSRTGSPLVLRHPEAEVATNITALCKNTPPLYRKFPRGLLHLELTVNLMEQRALKEQRGGESVTGRVVREVAEREGVDPIELTPPLNTAVDTDALESMFSDSVSGKRREGIRIEFDYCGYDIVVEGENTVRILGE